MTISLVGGDGFIGEYLSSLLKKKDNCQVVIVEREDSILEKCKKANVIVIMTQPNKKVIEDVKSIVSSSKYLKKVVYLSTLLLYPDLTVKQKEETLPDPKTTYEKNKHGEEIVLAKATKKAGCKFCIARLGNVYGDVKNKGIINNILQTLKNNEEIIIQGDPKLKIRDYIFVEDVVNLIEFLIFYDQKEQSDVFNLCSGTGYSIGKLIKKIESVTGKKVNYLVVEPVLEKVINFGDNSKILNRAGFQLKYDLNKGLIKTYQNYLKKGYGSV